MAPDYNAPFECVTCVATSSSEKAYSPISSFWCMLVFGDGQLAPRQFVIPFASNTNWNSTFFEEEDYSLNSVYAEQPISSAVSQHCRAVVDKKSEPVTNFNFCIKK